MDDPTSEVKGACPVCQSAISAEGGVFRGGEPSAAYQELQRKAAAMEEWRAKALAAATAEPSATPAPEPAPQEEIEYFL
jgi:hypothetical protein